MSDDYTWLGPREADRIVTAYGITDLIPPDAMERTAAGFGGVIRPARPVVEGRPAGSVDSDSTPLPPPLPELVNVAEAPAPEPPAPTLADLAAAVAALQVTVTALQQNAGPVTDLPPLSAEDWNGS